MRLINKYKEINTNTNKLKSDKKNIKRFLNADFKDFEILK